MAIKETFTYTNYTVSIEEWVSTLSDTEQQEYAEARIRQTLFREQAIAEGIMKFDLGSDSYIWPDEQAITINKPTDQIWREYFERYLTETNTGFHRGTEKI